MNCRVLDDTQLNIFKGIFRNSYFVIMLSIIFFLQIIFLTFCGPGIKTVWWGLDPISWIFCIAVALIGMLLNFILKLIPLEKVLPGGGQKEITQQDLNKLSTMSIKKRHDSNFYRNQSGMIKGSGIIEDKNIN